MTTSQDPKNYILDWEEAKSFPALLKAFLPTCSAILFRPVEFFRQFTFPSEDTPKRVRAAVAFALVLGYIKLFFDMLNLFWLKALLKSSAGADISALPAFLLSSPLVLMRPVISFFITLALVFFGIKLVLGLDKKFLPVLLVVCYQSASDLFLLIPVIGGLLSLVWALSLILIGIRELYKIDMGRSLLAAVVIPAVLLFSVALAIGPSLSRTVISLYPEARLQMQKYNDINAYIATTAIVDAAGAYKKDLGFYPVNLAVLSKYLPGGVMQEATRNPVASGYFYNYTRTDENHFTIFVTPQPSAFAGVLSFYADDTGKVRLGHADGKEIKSVEELQESGFAKEKE